MSGIDNIAQKILADAQAEAQVIVEKGQAQAADILDKAKAQAQAAATRQAARAQVEADQARERILSAANLKARDTKLGAKQEALAGIFQEAKAQLEAMEDGDYTALLQAAVQKVNLSPQAIVMVPEGRLKAVQALGLDQKVQVANLSSGFQFDQDGVLLNYAFDALVDHYRTELEAQVAQTLFGK